MSRKFVLTKRQLKLHPFEYEREVGNLRYAARLAHLDGRKAHCKRYQRQADQLEAKLRAASKTEAA